MAKKNELPPFVKKRKIMFGEKVADRQRIQAGVEFMEAGRYDDALEFFVRSDAEEYVREIVEIALKECNVPVFLRAKVVLNEKPEKAELEEIADRALEMDSPAMAAVALQKAGLHEKAKEIRSEVTGESVDAEEEESTEGDGTK